MTDLKGAPTRRNTSAVAQNLGARLALAIHEATTDSFAVTVSIGVAIRTGPVDSGAWLHAADQAVFEAKRMAPG